MPKEQSPKSPPLGPPETETLDEKMTRVTGAIAVFTTRIDELSRGIDKLHDEFRAGLKAVRDDIDGELRDFDRRLADVHDNIDQDRDEEIRRQVEDLSEGHRNHMETRLKRINRELEWDIGNLRLEVSRLSKAVFPAPHAPFAPNGEQTTKEPINGPSAVMKDKPMESKPTAGLLLRPPSKREDEDELADLMGD